MQSLVAKVHKKQRGDWSLDFSQYKYYLSMFITDQTYKKLYTALALQPKTFTITYLHEVAQAVLKAFQ